MYVVIHIMMLHRVLCTFNLYTIATYMACSDCSNQQISDMENHFTTISLQFAIRYVAKRAYLYTLSRIEFRVINKRTK